MHNPKKPTVLVLRQLPRELARLAPIYETRRDTHPALAPYPTLDSLVTTLTRCMPESKPDRLALLCTLIDVHRQSQHPMWTAILFRAFRPMLNRIREKLIGAPPDELDAALLSSFLEALLLVDTKKDPPRVAKLVRWRTRRLVFRALRHEANWEEIGFGVDCETEPDPATEGDPILIAVWLREEQGDSESVELVRTLFERGALWTLVRRRYADRPAKEQRTLIAVCKAEGTAWSSASGVASDTRFARSGDRKPPPPSCATGLCPVSNALRPARP